MGQNHMDEFEELIKILKEKNVWDQLEITEEGLEDALSITLEEEAKSLVADCFRNNPTLEYIHGRDGISQEEMKEIMKYAVNRMYYWLCVREISDFIYQKNLKLNGLIYSDIWDDPDIDVEKQMIKDSEITPMAISWLIAKFKYGVKEKGE